MRKLLKLAIVGCVLAVHSLAAWGDDRVQPARPGKLVVGTKHSPPFAIKNPDGEWTGISIELWRHLADYFSRPAANEQRRLEPRKDWPRGSPCTKPQVGIDGAPGDPVIIEIDCLPVIRVRRAA
jgi:ABC-type amino acid transport substrate-binding protein